MNTKPTTIGYKKLISAIESLLHESKSEIIREVNRSIISTYWHIGQHIVVYEQGGRKRAEYGSELLKRLSKDLSQSFGRGYSYRNLKLIRKFYLTFHNWQSLIAKSTIQKGQSVIALSQNSIVQSVIAQLSWTHFVRLLSVSNEDERNFYLIETAENRWSVRELDRQINTSLYERLLLSKNINEVKTLSEKGQIVEDINDLMKEPYILEFLGLEESHKYSENDLETAIIDNLSKFLLELGKGFSFVARQQRFSAGTDHFYIDLVFYNRLLNCFVLLDLKIGKIKHQDIGQMQMYVNYYDREIKTTAENSTIGIILCKEKHDLIVKYTLPEDNNQIFAKKYQLYLPKKEELTKLLQQYL
ncbi:MAG: PDDEXK nuclease domain-containing protein [Bacteroidota bacterium]|nr:PDDEXK nuclease domain-containing protein [Bacteroidota bacterium]